MGIASGSPAAWVVELHDEFEAEFDAFDPGVQDSLLAAAKAVQIAGPKAGRPHVDTLVGSKYPNMKELRFAAHRGTEEWRAAFAFDPYRKAIILVAGAKQGVGSKRFYRQLISIADARFNSHLKAMATRRKSRE